MLIASQLASRCVSHHSKISLRRFASERERGADREP